MGRKLVISCAVNGGADPKANPAIPITPAQIARSALDAARAGAAMVHLHVRDVNTGMGCMDFALYRETVQRIRDRGSDVIINLTGGAGAMFYPSDDDPRVPTGASSLATTYERIGHIEELVPDMGSLPMGSCNKAGGIYLNSDRFILDSLKRFQAAGVKPELDVSDPGHLVATRELIERGLVGPKPVIQFCLGWPASAPATPETVCYMKSLLPMDAIWLAFGRGVTAFPVAAMSIMLGGNVRVGLEDTPWISEGTLAPSNAALVERAVDLMAILGAEPATPLEARSLLALPEKANNVARSSLSEPERN
ncbi:3-keto-5-aminohexanoate cleavage protein [Microvirga tunisiensis]|uniref:3-keto-5-aminohexanoate cleavage protein n=1 Tax=Microvirga tunisiensis TaxID=2108360 RepID=A0A5N7MBN5_9HYPH|nr:3-keto-5-aminohexanoate cleavage protein [Microvirga tunisiensis]MPR05458.1 3-keto-5-aminohexanoate cleavage protein [Microvirga tunisiensis]MPR23659.1 3-keto-5-aminohexanoate cleavage protein [Microvirga tunisiensis]